MGAKLLKIQSRDTSKEKFEYQHFAKINGRHPWQDKVPGAYVLYSARKRPHGKVAYFNFELAREMGLISDQHPDRISKELEDTLLDTFAIQIINEYDIINRTPIDPKEIKPNKYMATRYLQLQHPNKQGRTSGDGRSIWNGTFHGRGKTWDITSCGTGATCLSPATALEKKYFRTGDPSISYGCGYADLEDGIETAIFSEIFRKNNIQTERCLCIIEFPGELAINVRAGQNLIRPSHFFNHLKQSNQKSLRAAIDFFVQRQIANRSWSACPSNKNIYDHFLEKQCQTFAEMAARFETQYIFCWLAWDGDNILADGGIIDYGSIRQFGLFHHEYRFDDTDRWSTNIKEQKAQARYTVQTFAQAVDFIKTHKKKPISHFRKHPILKEFDRQFETTKTRLLLERVGYQTQDALTLMNQHPQIVKKFLAAFNYFERATSYQGLKRVHDGVSADAVFCMRDILREFPKYYQRKKEIMNPRKFIAVARSEYAKPRDCKLTSRKKFWVTQFQIHYVELIEALAKSTGVEQYFILKRLVERSKIINRYDRITGDSICHVAERVCKGRHEVSSPEFHRLIKEFVEDQVLIPETRKVPLQHPVDLGEKSNRIVKSLIRYLRTYRQGL